MTRLRTKVDGTAKVQSLFELRDAKGRLPLAAAPDIQIEVTLESAFEVALNAAGWKSRKSSGFKERSGQERASVQPSGRRTRREGPKAGRGRWNRGKQS